MYLLIREEYLEEMSHNMKHSYLEGGDANHIRKREQDSFISKYLLHDRFMPVIALNIRHK